MVTLLRWFYLLTSSYDIIKNSWWRQNNTPYGWWSYIFYIFMTSRTYTNIPLSRFQRSWHSKACFMVVIIWFWTVCKERIIRINNNQWTDSRTNHCHDVGLRNFSLYNRIYLIPSSSWQLPNIIPLKRQRFCMD